MPSFSFALPRKLLNLQRRISISPQVLNTGVNWMALQNGAMLADNAASSLQAVGVSFTVHYVDRTPAGADFTNHFLFDWNSVGFIPQIKLDAYYLEDASNFGEAVPDRSEIPTVMVNKYAHERLDGQCRIVTAYARTIIHEWVHASVNKAVARRPILQAAFDMPRTWSDWHRYSDDYRLNRLEETIAFTMEAIAASTEGW
jgi:hypothetical protein